MLVIQRLILRASSLWVAFLNARSTERSTLSLVYGFIKMIWVYIERVNQLLYLQTNRRTDKNNRSKKIEKKYKRIIVCDGIDSININSLNISLRV